MKINILVISLVFLIFSCSNLGEYNFQPIPKVKLNVVLNNLDYNSEGSNISTSLYFDYKIINESKSDIYFNFDSIKVQFNGNVSTQIYFNSIASVIPTRKRLKDDENHFSLYAVFSDSLFSSKPNNFKIVSYGFVQ
jgi:hypothetical protein